jgi:hypothetical protein
MKHWTAIAIIAIIAGILSQCGSPGRQPMQIGPYAPEQFNALGREQQIMTCAGCHPAQYANEQLGPHAHSYRALEDLDAYQAHPDYHLGFYAEFVGRSRDVQCMGCHAPEDLFSAFYSEHLTAPDSLIASWHEAKPKLPIPRTKGQHTGVDCLTCHYDGHQVITSDGFTPSPGIRPEQSCSPRPSAFFASDYSCFSCHSVSFEGRPAPPGLASLSSDDRPPSCISCHQQYDANGKGTHYFYWKLDPANRPKPPHLAEFFAPCTAIRKADSVEVRWMNSLMPHPMSRAPEWFLDIALTDSTGTELARQRAYINRKEEHDRTVRKTFGRNVLPGTFGFDPVTGDTLTVTFPLQRGWAAKGLHVNTEAYSKSQYWHHDSIGVRQAGHRMEVK